MPAVGPSSRFLVLHYLDFGVLSYIGHLSVLRYAPFLNWGYYHIG